MPLKHSQRPPTQLALATGFMFTLCYLSLTSFSSAQIVVHKFTYDKTTIGYNNLTTHQDEAAERGAPFPRSIIAGIAQLTPTNPLMAGKWNGHIYIASVDLKRVNIVVSELVSNTDCVKQGKRVGHKGGDPIDIPNELTTVEHWVTTQAPTIELAINTQFFISAKAPGNIRDDRCGAISGVNRRNSVSQPPSPDVEAKVNNELTIASLILSKSNIPSIDTPQNAMTGYNVVSGVPLMQEGVYVPSGPSPDIPVARTAICFGESGILWVVVWVPRINGVKSGSGISLPALAQLMDPYLNCKNAINFDGSGSTQLYYRKKGKAAIEISNTSDTEAIPRPVISFIGFESR